MAHFWCRRWLSIRCRLTTRDNLRLRLEAARDLTGFNQANGINGRDRDFSNVVDSTISALLAFDRLLGLRIEHSWAEML